MRSVPPTGSGTATPKDGIFGAFQPQFGFHETEEDELGYFVWTRKKFRVRKPAVVRWVEIDLCYYGDEGRLVLKRESCEHVTEIELHKGWGKYPLDLSGLSGTDVEFEVDPLISVTGDSRELGVMLRSFEPLQDSEQYELLRMRMSNRRLNAREFSEGKALLCSYPPHLRFDIETRCNLRPRCAYCHWDHTKLMEEESPLRDPLDTISRLDEFLTYAEQIVDCGFGEPLLNPDLPQILDELKARRIRLEMTSNGVLLAPEIRKVLLGRQLTLYVSIDSATEQGYRRYRSASLEGILNNLRCLCTEKRNGGGLPRVVVSFIAMSSNLGEFEQFLERMVTVGVDNIKLRSLYCEPGLEALTDKASSRKFDYRGELLDTKALSEFLHRAKELARSAGIPLACEHDFCRDLETAEGPLCSEPWQALYLLNRGIMHCCFAKSPVFTWSQRGDKTLARFLRDAWNSPIFQDIRAALAQQRLHERCAETKSCPIVKKWFKSQSWSEAPQVPDASWRKGTRLEN
jgi:MoaA/NifB/PqqE/SkfB family radical SAM enzyme